MSKSSPNIKRLWLVRHAESRAQTDQELSIDSSLSRLGMLQAEQLKPALAGIKFDIVFISPLKRARQTYEHSGLDCANVEFDSRLVEYMPDDAYSQILPYEQLPGYGRNDRHDAWNTGIRDRAKAFADEIRAAHFEKILLFSHSGFLSMFATALICPEADDRKCSPKVYLGSNNCGISSLTIDKEADTTTILFWNSVAHVQNLIGYNPMK